MTAAWYDAIRPITVTVRCCGVDHRVSWRHGRLVLHDHDADAEQAVVALGGEPPLCAELLEAWRSAPDDPSLLVQLVMNPMSDAPVDLGEIKTQFKAMTVSAARTMTVRATAAQRLAQLSIQSAAPKAPSSWFGYTPIRGTPAPGAGAWAVTVGGPERSFWHEAMLRNLPVPLRAVLIACLIRAFEHRPLSSSITDVLAEGVLEPAARTALQESLRSWLPPYSGGRLAVAGVRLLPAGEAPEMSAETAVGGAGAVHAALPMRWLGLVWAQGIAVVDGCFIIDIVGAIPGGSLRARAVRWRRLGRDVFGPETVPAVISWPGDRPRLWFLEGPQRLEPGPPA